MRAKPRVREAAQSGETEVTVVREADSSPGCAKSEPSEGAQKGGRVTAKDRAKSGKETKKTSRWKTKERDKSRRQPITQEPGGIVELLLIVMKRLC